MPSLFGGEEEGGLQTRQPLGLEAEPRNRGLLITGSQSPGPIQNKQKGNKTNLSSLNKTKDWAFVQNAALAINIILL